jgi:hypothetical protein
VQAGVGDLFDLIHWINPSNRNLSSREAGKAYETKVARQSLLIEDFSEELLIETLDQSGDQSRKGVVGICHRFLPLDACHAIVSQLSPQARAWVQLQLDSKDEDPFPLVPGNKEKERMERGLERLLVKGDEALALFDFPKAAEFYEKVLRRSKAWKDDRFFWLAAKAYLVLMVDHWVDDKRVLAFLEELPEGMVSHPDFLSLFAVSLARLGEIPYPKDKDALLWIQTHGN